MKNCLAAETSLYQINKRLLETEIRTTLASGDLLVVFMVAVSILLSPPPSHFLGGFLVGGGSHRSSLPLPCLPPTCTAGQSTVNQHFIVFRPCWHPPHYLWQTLPGNKHNHGRVLRPLLPDHTLDQAHLSVKGSWSRSGRR